MRGASHLYWVRNWPGLPVEKEVLGMEGNAMNAASRPTDSLGIQREEEARRPFGRAVQPPGPGASIPIPPGTYREQVNLDKQLTIRPYGDGAVTVDGECQREHGVYIGSGSGMVIQDFTIKRTVGASVLIQNNGSPPSDVTVEGMTLLGFHCTLSGQDPADWGRNGSGHR